MALDGANPTPSCGSQGPRSRRARIGRWFLTTFGHIRARGPVIEATRSVAVSGSQLQGARGVIDAPSGVENARTVLPARGVGVPARAWVSATCTRRSREVPGRGGPPHAGRG